MIYYIIINLYKIMDIILNKLPDEHEKNKTLWIYEDNIPLFDKYNQFKKEPIIEIKKEVVKDFKKEPIIEIKKEVVKDFKKEPIIEIKKEVVKEIKKEVVKENIKQTPINLIINQTFTANVMKNEVRQKIIDFVTEPEFSKAFGSKKSGEIVSAILRDSWNQSTALFISFLLDANVIYKDKSYLYNKDKNKLEIMIK
jgi:translation initiation factor 2 beta subunit (eIF-2beta)/eIF-5